MTNSNIATFIDAYASITALIVELERKKAFLKKELNFLEEGAHEGNDWVLTVSVSDRKTLDMDAVREKLSDQFIRAHTTTTPVTMFRTKARVKLEA